MKLITNFNKAFSKKCTMCEEILEIGKIYCVFSFFCAKITEY